MQTFPVVSECVYIKQLVSTGESELIEHDKGAECSTAEQVGTDGSSPSHYECITAYALLHVLCF